MSTDSVTVSDPQRLASLRQTQLLDTPEEESFDRITRLAAKLLGVPVALISLVDIDRQFFKSQVGLPEPWRSTRQTPLTHSFCKHVVTSGQTLAVSDARMDPRLSENLAVRDLSVVSYLGAPLTGPGGHAIGALCAIDGVPRQWTTEQQAMLTDLAAFVVAETGSRRASTIERSAEISLQKALEQLRLSEAEARFHTEFRFLADAMPQIVWTSKPEGGVDYYNKRWFDYTGMNFEQTKDLGWQPVTHPEDLQPCMDKLAECYANCRCFEMEIRLKRASDGAYRWHLARSVPMLDNDGNILRWVGTSTDIQDQKATSAALQDARDRLEERVRERTVQLAEKQSFLQAVLESNVDGILACDSSGKLTLFNRALRELIDDENYLAPDKWAESYHLVMPDGVTPIPSERRPLTRALSGEIIRDEEVLAAIKGRSSLRRMRVNGRRISDEMGNTLGAVIAAHDITERTAAEARFRRLFECSLDPHLLVAETGIIDCNQAALTMLRCTDKAELMHKQPSDFSPEFQPGGRRSLDCQGEVNEIVERTGTHRFEWTHRRLDGTDVPVEVTLTTVELDGNKHLLSVWHDLTERKNAENKLKLAYSSLTDANMALLQSEERFHTFMDYSPAAAFIKDENGRFIYVNRRFATICGSTPEAMVGTTHFNFQGDESAAIVHAADMAILRGNTPMEAEAQPPFPTGDTGRWMMLKFPLNAPDGRKMIGGIAFDVSAAKKAETEIERQKQFIEAVIENASDGIIACDQTGNITCMNRAIRNMQGVEAMPPSPPREWFVKHFALYDPVTGQRLEWNQRPLARALRNERVDHAELVLKPQGRPQVIVVVSACPISGNAGEIIGAVCAYHDVTDLRRSQTELIAAKENADAANLAKSEFLANMSHEIRTPMTAILGYTDLLGDPTQSAKQRAQHVSVVRRNGQHLMQLLSDILDLSKIEAGEMTLEQLEFNPNEMLSEVESLMRPHASGKKISLATMVSAQLPGTVISDPTRLKQILLNLVGNAVKFTHKGGVQVVAGMDAGRLWFEVSDSGIGITPRQMSTLFHPFRQADGSTTRRFGGTGLGLAICKRLANMLGGELTVSSEAGVGSTFTLLLPVQMPAAETSTPAIAVPSSMKSADTIHLSGSILLAEDGIDNQRLARLYLEAAGLSVSTAINGKIAVESVLEAARAGKPFDAVLMDMQMPELDGYGATAQLRRAGFTQLPIIAFTAHALSSEREHCLRNGCNDYVSKPIDRNNLIQVLAKYFPSAQIDAPAPLQSEKAQDPLISTILDDYIKGLPEQIAKISQHLSRADLRALKMIVHQLKGSGGSYGFPQISIRAKNAEVAITAKEPIERITHEVQSLVELIRRVEGYDRCQEVKTS
jgi:PAS domain S-box-containing protein